MKKKRKLTSAKVSKRTPRDPQTSALLRLPVEVRDLIYNNIFSTQKVNVSPTHCYPIEVPALAQSCRQLRSELLHTYVDTVLKLAPLIIFDMNTYTEGDWIRTVKRLGDISRARKGRCDDESIVVRLHFTNSTKLSPWALSKFVIGASAYGMLKVAFEFAYDSYTFCFNTLQTFLAHPSGEWYYKKVWNSPRHTSRGMTLLKDIHESCVAEAESHRAVHPSLYIGANYQGRRVRNGHWDKERSERA